MLRCSGSLLSLANMISSHSWTGCFCTRQKRPFLCEKCLGQVSNYIFVTMWLISTKSHRKGQHTHRAVLHHSRNTGARGIGPEAALHYHSSLGLPPPVMASVTLARSLRRILPLRVLYHVLGPLCWSIKIVKLVLVWGDLNSSWHILFLDDISNWKEANIRLYVTFSRSKSLFTRRCRIDRAVSFAACRAPSRSNRISGSRSRRL